MKIFEKVTLESILTDGKSVTGVETNRGPIKCEILVNCGGQVMNGIFLFFFFYFRALPHKKIYQISLSLTKGMTKFSFTKVLRVVYSPTRAPEVRSRQ